MANATASDVDLGSVKFNGGLIKQNVAAAVAGTMLTQTISGASTVEYDLRDPTRALLRSEVCQARTTTALDDLTFELAQVTKQGNLLTVTFEDYAVACLRHHKTVVKAASGTTSRVEFCRRLIQADEPWIVVEGPGSGPTILEEISTGQTSSTTSVSSLDTPTPSTDGTMQLSALQVGQYAYDAGFRGSNLAIAIAVAHAESGFNATDVGHDSNGTQDWGVWQINSSNGQSKTDMFDPVKNATEAHKLWVDRGWEPWSTYNNGAYKQYLAEAQTIATQVGSGGNPPTSTTSTSTDTSSKPEDHWSAITRIMGEIQWRVFARRGHIVIAPDSWLLKQAGITVSENSPGVDSIDFDVDRGKKVSNVTITCRADRWGALPGEPVTVENMGPADDTWLLSQITRPLTSTTATISLIKKQKALPEPASDSSNAGQSGVGTSEKPKTLGTASPDVRRMVTWMLDKAADPSVTYLMGGNGPHEYDCSGFVVAGTAIGGHRIGARTADTQYELCKADNRLISVESAMFTCGALLFGAGTDGSSTHPGHVAVSLGNGTQTVQARGTAYGVGVFTVPDSEWSFAALAPGFSY